LPIVFIRNLKNANEINAPRVKSDRLLVARFSQIEPRNGSWPM
jgi:hypothetical protein